MLHSLCAPHNPRLLHSPFTPLFRALVYRVQKTFKEEACEKARLSAVAQLAVEPDAANPPLNRLKVSANV